MSSSQKDRLTKDYNIVFEGPIDSVRKPNWPRNCETVFDDIRELGRTDVNEFRDGINADSRRCPWRGNVQRRADHIAEQAKQCLETRKNELGWRLNLEHAIMGRFSVEVACYENGISSLFDNTADETMEYSTSLQANLPKRERPDRVYGLKPTNRIERLLRKVEDLPLFADCESYENTLKKSPFKEDSSILFPFLILEAKSEKTTDVTKDIQLQTAFGIRELLCIQDQLAQAAGEDDTWDAGPLVWFLSNKGEQWKVSAAYIDRQGKEKVYRVVQLWNGGVNSREHALQLLLILDYIVDWARDLYREGVAQSLNRLAGDSRTLACDTDVASLSGKKVQDWACTEENEDSLDYPECPNLSGDPLRAFDSSSGAFRDARFIKTRFIGLYITEDNFDQLVNCTPSQEASKKLMRSLLESLEESCRVRRDALDELEVCWTSKNREGSDMTPPDEIFFASITALWYFTPDWEQTRELSYLAISERLVDRIIKISGISQPSNEVLSRIPLVTSIPSFGELLNRDAVDNISACASRACIYTRDVSRGISPNNSFVWRSLEIEKCGKRRSRQMDIVIRDGPRSKAREFVFALYLKHKIGRNEPTSPIFRLSSRLDELAPLKSLLDRDDILSEDVWPWTSAFPELRHQQVVVAMSKSRQNFTDRANLCLFLMDPSILERGVPTSVLYYAPRWHFCVKIFDKKDGWERGWNMKSVLNEDARDAKVSDELNRFVTHLKTRKYGKKTQWEILTQGGIIFDGLDSFTFDDGSPYRRQKWSKSGEVPALKIQESSGDVSEPDYILIDDDDDDDAPTFSQSPTKKPWGSPVSDYDIRARLKQKKLTNDETGSQKSDAEKGKGVEMVMNITVAPAASSFKRPRDFERDNEESESSTQGTRRRRVAEEVFARDFMDDDEFDDLLKRGALS